MIPLGIVASSRAAATADSAATTALRQYVAGSELYGRYPLEGRGEIEILKPASVKPEVIVMQ